MCDTSGSDNCIIWLLSCLTKHNKKQKAELISLSLSLALYSQVYVSLLQFNSIQWIENIIMLVKCSAVKWQVLHIQIYVKIQQPDELNYVFHRELRISLSLSHTHSCHFMIHKVEVEAVIDVVFLFHCSIHSFNHSSLILFFSYYTSSFICQSVCLL